MVKKARQILYFVFLAAFMVAAPLVVLYTAGYRYHFGAGTIVQTGVISITSNPKGAEIFLDGQRVRKSTPAVLDTVFPGRHEIRLEKEGYTAWEKTVTVDGNETTFIKGAALFAQSEPRLIADADQEEFFPSRQSDRLAYLLEENGWQEVWVYDAIDFSQSLLARLPAARNPKRTLEWSADGSFIAVISQQNGLTVDLVNTQSGEFIEVDSRVPGLQDGYWDAEGGHLFYLQSKDGLQVFDAKKDELRPVIDGQAAALAWGNEFILSQTIDDQVIVALNQGESFEIIAYLPLGDYHFQPAPVDNLLLLEDKERERIVLVDAASRQRPILLNALASFWSWEPEGKRLLYSDGFDLHIYDLEQHMDETLTRLSQPITGLDWYPAASSVLFMQKDKIQALDLDRRGGFSAITLLEGDDLANLSIDPRGRAAYFTGVLDEQSGIYSKGLLR